MRKDIVWVIETENPHAMVDLRTTILALDESKDVNRPVVLRRTHHMDEAIALHESH